MVVAVGKRNYLAGPTIFPNFYTFSPWLFSKGRMQTANFYFTHSSELKAFIILPFCSWLFAKNEKYVVLEFFFVANWNNLNKTATVFTNRFLFFRQMFGCWKVIDIVLPTATAVVYSWVLVVFEVGLVVNWKIFTTPIDF